MVAPAVLAPPGPRLAERWRRIVGFVVDSALSTVVFLSGTSVLRPLGHGPLGFLVVLGWTAPLVNHGVGVALWGESLGKLVTRTKVVSVATEAVPGWRAAIIRWAVPGLIGFVRLAVPHLAWLALADVLWTVTVYAPILGPDRRGLHDRWAATIVVRTSSMSHLAVTLAHASPDRRGTDRSSGGRHRGGTTSEVRQAGGGPRP